MSAAQVATSGSTSTFATWMRYLLIAFAWLFTLGAVIQVFLIGLGLFESGSYLSDHTDFGHMIGPLTYLLPIVALLGRVGKRLVGHAFVVLFLYVVQIILPTIDEGWIAAFHAINAFILIGSAADLGRATLDLVRARTDMHEPTGLTRAD